MRETMPKNTCWECGKILKGDMTNMRFCKECKITHQEKIQDLKSELARLRDELGLEKALGMLEKQGCDLAEFKESSEAISEKTKEKSNMFGSSHEILATMELIRNRIRVKTQYSIGRYRVDLALMDENIFLEIDGNTHSGRLKKDKDRDTKIRSLAGPEWEIVRIPTGYLEKNIKKLLPAIREIRDFQQDIRNHNGGLMPKWFSARDERAWAELARKFDWKPKNLEVDKDDYLLVGTL